jgi:hypothetical protein
MHAYGVTNPLPDVPSVEFKMVVAKIADGSPYCSTMAAALALPPNDTGNPPTVAHDGTVPVDLRIWPAVPIPRKAVAPAADW